MLSIYTGLIYQYNFTEYKHLKTQHAVCLLPAMLVLLAGLKPLTIAMASRNTTVDNMTSFFALPFNIYVFSVFVQSLFERQGLALHGALHPALEKAHMQLPKSMARTKSFGNIYKYLKYTMLY